MLIKSQIYFTGAREATSHKKGNFRTIEKKNMLLHFFIGVSSKHSNQHYISKSEEYIGT
jgi:hypothetical protein